MLFFLVCIIDDKVLLSFTVLKKSPVSQGHISEKAGIRTLFPKDAIESHNVTYRYITCFYSLCPKALIVTDNAIKRYIMSEKR